MSATLTAPATARPHRQRLVSAEILKVTSTKMWLAMLVGVVLYIGIGVIASIFAPAQPGVDVPTLETEPGMRNLFAQAGGAYVFAIVLGALGMTQELRHQTITSTFLAEPRRNRSWSPRWRRTASSGRSMARSGSRSATPWRSRCCR